MSATADAIEIELDASDTISTATLAGEAEIEVTPPEKEPKPVAKTVVDPEEGIAKLQKQLADERAAREEAQRNAEIASQAEVKARTEVQTTQLDLVKNAISQITAQKAALKQQYAAAAASGDWDAAAEAQSQMADAAAQLTQLEAGRKQMEKAPKPEPIVMSDPVEQLASRVSPPSAAWLRAHPDMVRDPVKNRRMIRAAEDAVDEGIAPDSPEYFAYVEKRLGIGQTTQADDSALSQAAAPKTQRTAPASAPVSRSGNGAAPRSNVVTLTAEEREMASIMGMSDKEYAQNKIALKREGKLN
jgi:hypothetical protein